MSMLPQDDMLYFRTLSQLIRLFILPEIATRLADGRCKHGDLPLELFTFRIVQVPNLSGALRNAVELNEEVRLVVTTRAKRAPIATRELLTTQDIDINECFVSPPEHEGRRVAYFLFQRLFLNWLLIFDCMPNVPTQMELGSLDNLKQRFPLADLINTRNFCDTVRPLEKLALLTRNNWPPAPGYFPSTLAHVHADPNAVRRQEFVETVAVSYSQEYWHQRIAFWKETNFLPNRIQYVETAIKRYFDGDYISPIYVLVPQFEGWTRDYLGCSGVQPDWDFLKCVEQLRELVFSRKTILFPKGVLDEIFRYLSEGSFWKYSGNVKTGSSAVNRHGILHGTFTNFESKEMALKYLILFESLAFVILHDRVLSTGL